MWMLRKAHEGGGMGVEDVHLCGYLELEALPGHFEKLLNWSFWQIKNEKKILSELGAVVPQSQGLGQHSDFEFKKSLFLRNTPQMCYYIARNQSWDNIGQQLQVELSKNGIVHLQMHFVHLNLWFWAELGPIGPRCWIFWDLWCRSHTNFDKTLIVHFEARYTILQLPSINFGTQQEESVTRTVIYCHLDWAELGPKFHNFS